MHFRCSNESSKQLAELPTRGDRGYGSPKTSAKDSTHTDDVSRADYSNVLEGVTIYTTLESCAQRSGIMALAKVGSVVFLQTDPGQYSIGNIMRNMTFGTKLEAPHGASQHAKDSRGASAA